MFRSNEQCSRTSLIEKSESINLLTREYDRYIIGTRKRTKGGFVMAILNPSKARDNFYKLLEQTVLTHDPIYITGKNGNVVMISEEDYKAMEETIYLSSIPGMKEKLIEGMNTPLDECVEDYE